MEETKRCNYADNATIYACGPEIKTVLNHLERDALKIPEWFLNNFMKRIEDKCHLMTSGAKRDTEITIKIGEACHKGKQQSLLGISLDQYFSFKTHVKTPCKKASQKLYSLACLSCYMDTGRFKLFMRAFVLSQF